MLRPYREEGNKRCFCPSVAYIANNSRTQRPSVPKFGRKVLHLRCHSHTSFKVKRSNVRVGCGQGHTVSAEPGGHTACYLKKIEASPRQPLGTSIFKPWKRSEIWGKRPSVIRRLATGLIHSLCGWNVFGWNVACVQAWSNARQAGSVDGNDGERETASDCCRPTFPPRESGKY